MCPTAERRSAGFTLLELLIVLVIMGVLVAVGAGALSVERNPLYTGAQALVTASSTARILEGQFSLEQIRKEFL